MSRSSTLKRQTIRGSEPVGGLSACDSVWGGRAIDSPEALAPAAVKLARELRSEEEVYDFERWRSLGQRWNKTRGNTRVSKVGITILDELSPIHSLRG